VVHADETSWKQAGRRRVLWVVVTRLATVFTIATSRGSRVRKELIGEAFGGYLVSDRWSAYGWVPVGQRQVCWSHLARNFQGFGDRGGAAAAIGKPAVAWTKQLFAAWHAFRDDHQDRALLATARDPVQERFRVLLQQGIRSADASTQGLCRSLRDLWPAVWTFVTHAGGEPTNNTAERALRPAVVWRKGSFGTQSDGGARFVERLLTVAMTCRQQDRSLLAYLTAVCTAAQRGHTVPSLLPAPASAQGPRTVTIEFRPFAAYRQPSSANGKQHQRLSAFANRPPQALASSAAAFAIGHSAPRGEEIVPVISGLFRE